MIPIRLIPSRILRYKIRILTLFVNSFIIYKIRKNISDSRQFITTHFTDLQVYRIFWSLFIFCFDFWTKISISSFFLELKVSDTMAYFLFWRCVCMQKINKDMQYKGYLVTSNKPANDVGSVCWKSEDKNENTKSICIFV